MQPTVLIIEFREGFGAMLSQVAKNKGALVESLVNFDNLERKPVLRLIEQNFYKLVIMNYKMVKEYEPLDILALVKKNKVPFAFVYTDSLRAELEYEKFALWSLVVTDDHKDDPDMLLHALNEEFSLPPQGNLKYAL